jgi:hypothetical protein
MGFSTKSMYNVVDELYSFVFVGRIMIVIKSMFPWSSFKCRSLIPSSCTSLGRIILCCRLFEGVNTLWIYCSFQLSLVHTGTIFYTVGYCRSTNLTKCWVPILCFAHSELSYLSSSATHHWIRKRIGDPSLIFGIWKWEMREACTTLLYMCALVVADCCCLRGCATGSIVSWRRFLILSPLHSPPFLWIPSSSFPHYSFLARTQQRGKTRKHILCAHKLEKENEYTNIFSSATCPTIDALVATWRTQTLDSGKQGGRLK